MTDPNEKAKVWLRHLMEQIQHLVAKNWITEQLLYASHPAVTPQQWDELIQLALTAPKMKEQLSNSQKVIDQSLKNFEDTIKVHEVQKELDQAQNEIAELEKKFIELYSQLPPPKFPN